MPGLWQSLFPFFCLLVLCGLHDIELRMFPEDPRTPLPQHAHPCDPGDRAQQPTELGESFVVEWPTISFFSLAPGSSLRYSDCCSV
uniref:Putative secreted peptide n=1 Tax=Anopheles braziliensis TaxID=58242 RepID=A0A2M3ZMD4_9DIPT